MKTKILSVVAYHTDNGDGTTSVQLFNNREELKHELEELDNGTTIEDVESGEDTYTHGSISEKTIELLLDDDGNVSLARGVFFTSDG